MHDTHLAQVVLAGPTAGPLVLAWPIDKPGGLRSFSDAGEWRSFVAELSLSGEVPEVVSVKFREPSCSS